MGRCWRRRSSIRLGIGGGARKGMPLLVEKFKTNLRRRFDEGRQKQDSGCFAGWSAAGTDASE